MIQKNKKNKFLLMLICILLLVTILINIVCFKIMSNDIKSEVKNKKNIVLNQTVNYNGYSFDLEKDDSFEYYENDLYIKTKSSYSNLKILNVNYEELINKKESIKDNLLNEDIIVKDISEKTYAGTTYLIFEIVSDDNSVLLSFSNLAGNNTLLFITTTADNTYSYKTLKDLSNFVKSASYYGEKILIEKNKLDISELINTILK